MEQNGYALIDKYFEELEKRIKVQEEEERDDEQG